MQEFNNIRELLLKADEIVLGIENANESQLAINRKQKEIFHNLPSIKDDLNKIHQDLKNINATNILEELESQMKNFTVSINNSEILDSIDRHLDQMIDSISLDGVPIKMARDHIKQIERLAETLTHKVDSQNLDAELNEELLNKNKLIFTSAISGMAGVIIGLIIITIITNY